MKVSYPNGASTKLRDDFDKYADRLSRLIMKDETLPEQNVQVIRQRNDVAAFLLNHLLLEFNLIAVPAENLDLSAKEFNAKAGLYESLVRRFIAMGQQPAPGIVEDLKEKPEIIQTVMKDILEKINLAIVPIPEEKSVEETPSEETFLLKEQLGSILRPRKIYKKDVWDDTTLAIQDKIETRPCYEKSKVKRVIQELNDHPMVLGFLEKCSQHFQGLLYMTDYKVKKNGDILVTFDELKRKFNGARVDKPYYGVQELLRVLNTQFKKISPKDDLKISLMSEEHARSLELPINIKEPTWAEVSSDVFLKAGMGRIIYYDGAIIRWKERPKHRSHKYRFTIKWTIKKQ